MTRSAYLGACGAAALCLIGAGASAQTFENDSGGSVRFYGQASPVIQSYDDGVETTTNLVDNANSNTRLGFVVTQPFDDNSLAFTFETSLGFIQSSEVSQTSKPPALQWEKTDLRKLEVAWGAEYGTFTLGQGPMATDNTTNLDASGTSIAGSVSVADTAGDFFFRDAAGALTGVTVGDAFNDLDGARRFRVRYDTPDYSGFTVAVAYGENILDSSDEKAYYDAAVRWSGETGDYEISAAFGYAWTEAPGNGGTARRAAGSATVAHRPTGLNLTLAGGNEIDGGSYIYGKAGWAADLVTVGGTAFAIDYYAGSDFATEGSSSDTVGLYAVQNFDDADLQAYLGLRSYAYSDADASYLDATSVLLGARYRF